MTGVAHRRSSLDIPKIKVLSWLGLESVIWALIIGHLVKWDGNFSYYATFQVKYAVGAPSLNTIWYLKDSWDRLPVHIQNGLPGIVSVAAALLVTALLVTAAVITLTRTAGWRRVKGRWLIVAAVAVILPALLGVAAGLESARQLAGWHVHWFNGQKVPGFWITDRHDIRDVGIALVATIVLRLLFAKPRYAADDKVTVKHYLTAFPVAIGAALIPIAAIGVLAWKVPWLQQHGWDVPARFGVLANEINGWIAAGTWITVVMGVAGGLVAKMFIQRPADDIQWFFAERSAGRILSSSGLSFLRGGTRVLGTPSHRARVQWLLDHQPDLPERNPWLVRFLLIAGFFAVVYAGAGAWLTLVGPAAVH